MKSNRHDKQLWWLLQELEIAARASYDGVARYSVRSGQSDPSPETQHDLLIELAKRGAIRFTGSEFNPRHVQPQKIYELHMNSLSFYEVYNQYSLFDENADITEIGGVLVANATQYTAGKPVISYADHVLKINDYQVDITPNTKQELLCGMLFSDSGQLSRKWEADELYDLLYPYSPTPSNTAWPNLRKSVNDLSKKIKEHTNIPRLVRARGFQVWIDEDILNI